MKKYKYIQECILFCYDNADTSSAGKMKCENVQTKETICRVENTNINGNMNERINTQMKGVQFRQRGVYHTINHYQAYQGTNTSILWYKYKCVMVQIQVYYGLLMSIIIQMSRFSS